MPDGITKGTTDCEADDFLCRQWRACTPIDKHKKTTEANCLLSFTFLQRGSNGVAEARIPLKINIMLFAQPKYKCLMGLRKERQTAKQMIFCGQWRACTPIDKHKKNNRSFLLRLSFKKKRQPLMIVAFSVIPPGLEPGTPTLKVLCSTC